MIKYYWKQAWELLKQHKLFSVLYITGAGLAIAMTMVVFVAHYIRVAPVYPETNRAETWVLKSVTVQRVKTRGSGSWQSSHQFLFRRQRVSKGNFIFNRENIVRIRSAFLAERNASGLCSHSAAFRLRRKRPGRRTRPGRDGCVSDEVYGLLRSGRASRSKALSSCSGAGTWAEAASAFR